MVNYMIKEFAKLCREDETIKHQDGLNYAKKTVMRNWMSRYYGKARIKFRKL